ncbi:DUF3846 domain-containing protein [Kitasatospora sp. NPDC087315]|uniref:DUF3846 domain-containing protein n=1 Tax=Kitasatospora sp. NPDC087315 TaxID=3364069 RepID=UPI00381DC392
MTAVPNALVIHDRGSLELVVLPFGTGGFASALDDILDCDLITAMTLTERLVVWRDDDGINSGRPVNRAAGALIQRHRRDLLPPAWAVWGRAVLTGGADLAELAQPLTADQLAGAVSVLNSIGPASTAR